MAPHHQIPQPGIEGTPPSHAEGRPPRFQALAALRHADYRYHWLGTSFSSAATTIQQVTIALLVLDFTDSSFWVGTVLGIRALPILLIGPLAGVAVDRLDRKKLLMFTQLILAGVALVFAVGVSLDRVNVYHALIFSFLLGLDMSINQPVRQALVANVVPRADLPTAIALENTFAIAIRTIAPVLGLALLTPFGFAGNFFLQAGAYIAAAAVIIPMTTPYREGVVQGGSVWGQFMDGLRYIRTDVMLLLLIVLIVVPSAFVHSTQNLLVVFAEDILSGDKKLVLGLLYVSMGVGSMLAIGTLASWGNFRYKGRINMGSILLVTILLALFGLSTNLVLSLVLVGFMGMFNMGFRIVNNTLVQTRIPDVLRGRITSIYVIDHGMIPLSSLLLGALAEERVLGPGPAVTLVGLLALGVTIFIALRWRQLWRM